MTDVTIYTPPAFCTFPGCMEKIDKGLQFACGHNFNNGPNNCGKPFCEIHANGVDHICARCEAGLEAFPDREDQPQPQFWDYMLTAAEWAHWRETQPAAVERIRRRRAAWVAEHGED